MYMSIKEFFCQRTERFKNDLFSIEGEEKITYGQFRKDVLKCVSFLKTKKNEVIGIWSKSRYEADVAIFSSMLANNFLVLIDGGLGWKEARELLERAKVNAVFCDSQSISKIRDDSNVEVIPLDKYASYAPCSMDDVIPCDSEKPATLFYTSGTTGVAKGVVLSYQCFLKNAEFMVDAGFMQELVNTRDRFYSILPNNHVYYFAVLFLAINCGSAIIHNKDIKSLTHDLAVYRPGATALVPIVIQSMYEAATKMAMASGREVSDILRELTGGNLKHISTASAPIDHTIMYDFAKAGIGFIEAYGMTESAGGVIYTYLNTDTIDKAIKGYVGDLNSWYELKIADDGEILIRGDGLFLGYYEDEEATKEVMRDGWLATGDLGYISDNGLYLIGRKKNLIILGNGENVSPEEIENKLSQSRFIDEVLIKNVDESICAEIYSEQINESNYDETSKEILRVIDAYNQEAPVFKRVLKTRIRKVPFMRNAMGKVIRDGAQETGVYYEETTEYVAPSTEMERLVCDLFSEILNRDNVGVNDNFFALGGHSLRAARLINQVEEKTGKRIEINKIFTFPTPKLLSEYVEQAEAIEYVPIPEEGQKEYYETSPMQKSMFLIWELDKKSLAYNNPAFFKVSGNLDVNKMRYCLDEMVGRHEILRTRYFQNEEGVYQEVIDSENYQVDFETFEAEEGRKIEPASLVKPFDLENGKVLRLVVVKNQEECYFMIDIHHIAIDGMSMVKFLNEFATLYNGGQFLEAARQYKDYGAWRETRDLSAQEAYWKELLSDEIPVLDMPTDYPRPSGQSFRGADVKKTFNRELVNQISDLANQCGATEYMVLMSAAYVLLGKYGRQEDVIIGSPVNGRIHKDTEKMLGMFVNTLAMRGKPEGKKAFVDFLGEVKEDCLKAYENQEYPFEELVKNLGIKRDLSRNPLFDVMLVLQNNELPSLHFEGVKVEYEEPERTVSQFDLTFEIWMSEGEYRIVLAYSTDLFCKDSAERILNHYESILRQVIARPEVKIADIEMMDAQEKDLILNSFNATTVEYDKDKTIAELFEEQVQKTPDAQAVKFGDQAITYTELNEKANVLAQKLRGMGVKPNDFVAMLTERSIEMIIGIIGIIKAGAAYVPIDPMYPEDRIRYVLEDAQPKAMLTYKAETAYDCPVIDLCSEGVWEGLTQNPDRVNKAEDFMYCIYTSGTTGKPKGVAVTERTIINLVLDEYAKMDGSAFERTLFSTHYGFDVSVQEYFSTLLKGGCGCLISYEDKQDTLRCAKWITEYKVNTVFATPSYFEILSTEQTNAIAESVKHVILAGEAFKISDAMLGDERTQDVMIYNHYGPTETHVATINERTVRELRENRNLNIGRPIANSRVYMLQGDTLCGIGVPGELCIGGDCVAYGYVNKPELTAEKFVKDPYKEGRTYRTGDLARWISDGTIEYLGRIDEQVKIRGFRVELGEIDSRLREIKDVKDCAVIARADASGEKAIYAYVVSDGEVNASAIRSELGNTLPYYMIPSYVAQIEKIPVTKNGKLDRKSLPDVKAGSGREYVAPRNEIEEMIASIWAEVLQMDKISVCDSFFDVGGHSLLAMKLVHRINQEMETTITLEEFFLKGATIEDMALLVEENLLSSLTEEELKEFNV